MWLAIGKSPALLNPDFEGIVQVDKHLPPRGLDRVYKITVENGVLRVELLGPSFMVIAYGSNGEYSYPTRQLEIHHMIGRPLYF